MKDKELSEYYEESFNTFSTRGWKYFLEDMETLLEALNEFESVENIETLYFRKGQLDIIKLIKNRANDFDNAWQELNG
jgi:hypothetical protein